MKQHVNNNKKTSVTTTITTTTTSNNTDKLEEPTVHELIGLYASVVDAPNHSMIGLSGKITYETKSMIMIETNNGTTKQIPKDRARLSICHFNEKEKRTNTIRMISGSHILKRPFERIVI